MNAKNIVRLLKILGAENIHEGDEWVKASCLFAPWLHSKGTDTRPSFGISIGKRSHYHCFSCQKSGPLPILVTSLIFLSGRDFNKAQKFIVENESLGLDDYDSDIKDDEPLSVLPTILLRRYNPATTHLAYVRQRRITEEAIEHFKLRFDQPKSRLIFPIFDGQNHLVGIRGRTTNNDKIKYLEYSEVSPNRSSPKAHGIWFGMQYPPEKGKKLILVEGELDAVKLWQALKRPGIWASMGASISTEQIKTLESVGSTSPIVLFFDDDEAGRAATSKVVGKLKKVVPSIYTVQSYSGCKDPDEIVEKGRLKVALAEMVQV